MKRDYYTTFDNGIFAKMSINYATTDINFYIYQNGTWNETENSDITIALMRSYLLNKPQSRRFV